MLQIAWVLGKPELYFDLFKNSHKFHTAQYFYNAVCLQLSNLCAFRNTSGALLKVNT